MAAPDSLSRLVNRTTSEALQDDPAYEWPKHDWSARFKDHEEYLQSLPAKITQADAFRAASNATINPTHATHAFLATMAWGYGDSSYGWWRVERVLYKNRGAPAKLQQAAIKSRQNPESAYDYLAHGGRLHGLGPAFGTKYIHFCSVDGDGLVLDRLVALWLLKHTGLKLQPWVWSLPTYKKYTASMHAWASELHVKPTELEHLILDDIRPK